MRQGAHMYAYNTDVLWAPTTRLPHHWSFVRWTNRWLSIIFCVTDIYHKYISHELWMPCEWKEQSFLDTQLFNFPLRWRHTGHDGVSNHQPHDCLLNRLFRRKSKKTSKLRVTGLCAGNSPGTGEFPAQMVSNAENVSMWWRHHAFEMSRYFTGSSLFGIFWINTLRWRHDESDGVSNHQICLLNRLFIKASRHWPLLGEFTGYRWISRTKSQ